MEGLLCSLVWQRVGIFSSKGHVTGLNVTKLSLKKANCLDNLGKAANVVKVGLCWRYNISVVLDFPYPDGKAPGTWYFR